MKPGERISVIKEVADALAQQGWQDVDLILEQFGFATLYEWDGDVRSYVLAVVKNESDESLLALRDYLYPDRLADQRSDDEEAANALWEAGMFRLFISHSAKQRQEVGELKRELRHYGTNAFVAHDDINPTDAWRDVIEIALRTCEAMTAYLTPDFHPSKWADQEIGAGLARSLLIIPIRKGETPYGFIGKYQALSGANKQAPRLAEDLYGILAAHPLTAARIVAARTAAEVARFVDSGSYDEARANLTRLLDLPTEGWTPELLARILKAGDTNRQLDAQWNWGSTTVADEAKSLAERISKRLQRV